MTGSAIEGCEEATAPPYKGGGHQKAQPYVLPMPKSKEPYFLGLMTRFWYSSIRFLQSPSRLLQGTDAGS